MHCSQNVNAKMSVKIRRKFERRRKGGLKVESDRTSLFHVRPNTEQFGHKKRFGRTSNGRTWPNTEHRTSTINSRPRHRPKFVCFIGFPIEHDQRISLSPIRGQTDDWIICLQVVKVYEAKISPGHYIKRTSLSKSPIRGSKSTKFYCHF